MKGKRIAAIIAICCFALLALNGWALAQTRPESSIDLGVGGDPTNLGKLLDSQTVWLKLAPPESGVYRVTAHNKNNWMNLSATLWRDDDPGDDALNLNYIGYNSASGSDPCLLCETALTAGQVYYLELKNLSSNYSSDCTIDLSVVTETPLTLDQSSVYGGDASSRYVWFSFTPSETGTYEFISSVGSKSDVQLLDRQMEEVSVWGGEQEDGYRRIANLTSGEWYALRVYNWSGWDSISAAVHRFTGLINAGPLDGIASIQTEDGSSRTLAVIVESTGSGIEYQWYRRGDDGEGLPVDGETTATYETPVIDRRTEFFCRVTDRTGGRYDGSFIDVDFAVYIPTGLVLNYNDNYYGSIPITRNNYTGVNLEVKCTWTREDVTVSYQWYRKYSGREEYTPIEGSTSTSYQTGVIKRRQVYYQCVATDSLGNRAALSFDMHRSSSISQGFSAAAKDNKTYFSFTDDNYADMEDLTLEVVAAPGDLEEAALEYQWYYADGGYDIPIPGATDATLYLGPLATHMNYKCWVTNGFDEDRREIIFQIVVWADNALKAWVKGDADEGLTGTVMADLNTPATLEVDYSYKFCAPAFQWYVTDGGTRTEIEGATGDSFTTEPVTGATTYCCVVTDGKTTVDVNLTVTIDTHLSAAPKDGLDTIGVDPDTAATLSVDASCTAPLTYSWAKWDADSEEYIDQGGPDAQAADFETEAIDAPAIYQCTVTDSYGNRARVTFSVYAENHLTARALPDAEITVQPTETGLMTVEASCDTGALRYQWYYMGDGQADYNDPDNWDEIDGAEANAYDCGSVTCEKQYYLCAVADDYGNTENVRFTLTRGNGIVVTPRNRTVYVLRGDDVTLSLDAHNVYDRKLYYDWWLVSEGSSMYLGDETTYTATNVQDDAEYYCWVRDNYDDDWANKLVAYVSVRVIEPPTSVESDPLWEDAVYAWADDCGSVTATRAYRTDASVSLREVAKTTYTTTATCEAGGDYTYTASFMSAAFTTQTTTVQGDPLDHDWGFPTYIADDNSMTVTARLLCNRDSKHRASYTATADGWTVSDAPTETIMGARMYHLTSGFVDSEGNVNPDIPSENKDYVKVWNVKPLSQMSVLRLPSSLQVIDDESFMGSACEAIIIPPDCDSIGSMAFANCERLQFAYITGDIDAENIADDAFYGSSSVIFVCPLDSGAAEYADAHSIKILPPSN